MEIPEEADIELSSALGPLDPIQLRRIESVHRGFLYQHLYAVAILLTAQESSIEQVIVERDDDIELLGKSYRLFLQVKTRVRHLLPSDVADSLKRFADLRRHHTSHKPEQLVAFAVVSNAMPSESLLTQLDDWNDDCYLLTPAASSGLIVKLPRPQPDLAQLLHFCVELARRIPHSLVAPETLVLKLAACVQAASAGITPWQQHSFDVKLCPQLFEQLVVQLQGFPARAVGYRNQKDEPPYFDLSRNRLISAHSGAGKTAWASEAAQHTDATAIYFDIGGLPSSMLPAALSRELAASLFSGDDLIHVFHPGNVGVLALRAIDNSVKLSARRVLLVIDNIHTCDSADLVAVVSAFTSIRWVMLGQPHPSQLALSTELGVAPEGLSGWTTDGIAAACFEAGITIDLPTSHEIHQLTGGLPLFVLSLVRIVKANPAQSMMELCRELAVLTHVHRIPQEEILGRVFQRLPPDSRIAAFVFWLAGVALSASEAKELVVCALKVTPQAAMKAIRQAIDFGVISYRQDGYLILHDAFRILAAEAESRLSDRLVVTLCSKIVDALSQSLEQHSDIHRQRAVLRLLPKAGRIEELVDVATSMTDQLRELGLLSSVVPLLQELAESSESSAKDRIWIYDALAAFAYQLDDVAELTRCVDEMRRLVCLCEPSKHLRRAIATKEMILYGCQNRIEDARTELEKALALGECSLPDDLILKYNFAIAAYRAEEYDEVIRVTRDIVSGYHARLGITISDYRSKSVQDIWKSLVNYDDMSDDLRRLADAINLICLANQQCGRYDPQVRIQACKFYEISNSPSSTIECLRNVVDDFMAVGLPREAKIFMNEFVFPVIDKVGMVEKVLPARAHYAYVLWKCGERTLSQRLMTELRQIAPVGTDAWKLLEQHEAVMNLES